MSLIPLMIIKCAAYTPPVYGDGPEFATVIPR